MPSPHDWHDGASSITIDTILEDRLLSTSFITTLLEENASIRSARRTSRNSEAFSGFSEISYPPVASAFRDIHVQFSPLRTRMLRQPGWALPSAFTPIIESLNRLSEDSVNQDYGVKAAGFFNELHLKGSSSVHVTHALPPSPSAENLLDGYSQVDVDPYKGTGILPSNPSSLGTTSDEYLPEGSQAAHGRQSIPSIRSLVPSWISRISSSRSIRRVMARRTVRPLPPVPILNHTCVVETDGREADEFESLNPVNRSVIVDYGGNHSHRRRSSRFTPDKEEPFDDFMTVGLEMNFVQPKRSPQLERLFGDQWPWCFDTPMVKWDLLVQHQKRTFVILFVFLMVVFAAVGTTLGIVIRRKGATPVCSAGLAGARCDLNATCVCTSTSPGRCDGLAQNILDLIPTLNQCFLTNMTPRAVYNGIWLAQGAPEGSNCTSQSLLVDVAPALNLRTLPNVTQWAQTALLWNLIESQDIRAVMKLQNFIQNAPWNMFGQSVENTSFSVLVSGYTFNFAVQQVAPPNTSFVLQSQPTKTQLAHVGSGAQSVLDRMYSFAVASSTQYQMALQNYWISVLQQRPADLPVFISALNASPILLPFDVTPSPQTVASLLTVPAPSSFPPPLGCYPGLSSAQKEWIDSIEGPVFGLTPINNTTQFEPACYPDRPVYGVLDVLRLRLPFNDSRTDVARQAVVLKRDVVPRVLVYSGEALSSLPNGNMTTISREQRDPRQYGVLGNFDHVVLRYLSSISDIDVAIALVKYILGSASTPPISPTNTSILYESLPMIPVMEVAVFGSIAPSDIDWVVSAFSTTSGSLFFGSDEGGALRSWAIMGCGSMIAWSETALSPLVVHDRNLSDSVFNQTWTAVSTALHYNISGIGIANITEVFGQFHMFSA